MGLRPTGQASQRKSKIMELMRLRPFGKRKKTYFYTVASLVLAAHVVVGAIFHVMPPEFDEPGSMIPVEVQMVDQLLPDAVIESSAVQMVEDPVEKEEELPIFVPVWQGSPTAPDLEPLGPTESELPDVVIEGPEIGPTPISEAVPEKTPATTEETPAAEKPTPPPVANRKATPVSNKPPASKRKTPAQKIASKPPVKDAPPPRVDPGIERAIPVQPKSSGRTGLLNRMRNKPTEKRRDSGAYVAARWSKRPPPYYPYEARKNGIEGTAHVRVSIDSRGRITSSRIVKSAGDSLLDRAAMASVTKGILDPATRGGRAVASEMLVPFEFYLP